MKNYQDFKWSVPEFFNIGVACCEVHAAKTPDKTALIYENDSGKVIKYSFGEILKQSNKLANVLKEIGLVKGDRFAIFLSQQVETLISHLAGYKSGLINVPLFTLFGPEALLYRLKNSGAKAVIVNFHDIEKILSIQGELPELKKIIVVGKSVSGKNLLSFYNELSKASENFTPVMTRAEDPALIIYTSGTTGPPKGALHAHRMLIGHLPGVELPHNFFPQPGDLFWTPADWAWIGGLYDVLFPSLYYGIPVVAGRMRKFDAEKALHFIAKHQIRNVFMPPTALKLLRNVKNIKEKFSINLRSVASGGEPLGEEILNWGKEELQLDINEFYGQTEANLLVTNCSKLYPIKPGSMGKAVPGHVVKVVDEKGNILPPYEEGEIAVKRPDPVMFLEYWENRGATEKKFIGDWMLTGDVAKLDEEGYFWFSGRSDDVITSAGYRIGPAEIEDCLLKHPAVSIAAVIGKPDKLRGEIVKAFIVLRDGFKKHDSLSNELQNFVKSKLAAHEYPREIEFVETLPMTVTGKIKRKELKKMEIEKLKKGGETI